MTGRRFAWRDLPWQLIVFAIASLFGAIAWAATTTQRVNDQEAKATDAATRLSRIEPEVHALYLLFFGSPP